jgi:hypothetical protein
MSRWLEKRFGRYKIKCVVYSRRLADLGRDEALDSILGSIEQTLFGAKIVAVVPLRTASPYPVERHHCRLLQNPVPGLTLCDSIVGDIRRLLLHSVELHCGSAGHRAVVSQPRVSA